MFILLSLSLSVPFSVSFSIGLGVHDYGIQFAQMLNDKVCTAQMERQQMSNGLRDKRSKLMKCNTLKAFFEFVAKILLFC